MLHVPNKLKCSKLFVPLLMCGGISQEQRREVFKIKILINTLLCEGVTIVNKLNS